MLIQRSKGPQTESLIGALLVILTDWRQAEVRNGRRGDFMTTGAMQVRMRQLDAQTKEELMAVVGALGLPFGESDVNEVFDGSYDYQMSMSLNKFEVKMGKGVQLSRTDQRAIERLKVLLNSNKAEEVIDRLKAA